VTNELQTISRHDLEAQIVRRSREDEGFRREFTSNQSAAFTKYLNVPAADLPRIWVHQEEPGSWQIVMPAKPASELSEQELEKVAGGGTPYAISATVTVAFSVSVAVSNMSYVGSW
jgi:hypothetical protein